MRPWLLLLVLVLLAFAAWLMVGGVPATEDERSRAPAGEGPASGATPGLRGAPAAAGAGGDRAGAEPLSGDLPPWPVAEPETDESGTGRVSVLLVDAHGLPLPGHPIEASWWKAFGVYGTTTGRTDGEGRYRTDADEPWQLESVGVPVRAEGWSFLSTGGPFAASPSHHGDVVVEMPATVRVRGRVLDLDGQPVETQVECAALGVLDADPFLFRMQVRDTKTSTDEGGRFAVLLVAGMYRITLDDQGATARALVTLDEQRREVELQFVVARPVRGETLEVIVHGASAGGRIGVSARTEKPVFGLPAAPPGVRYRPREQFRRGATSDGQRFVIEGLHGHPWTLYVFRDGTQIVQQAIPPGASRMEVQVPPLPPAAPRPERTVRIVARLPDGTIARPSAQRYRGEALRGGGGLFAGPHDGSEGTPISLSGNEPHFLVVSHRDMAYAGVGPLYTATAPDRIEVPLERAQPARVEFVDRAGAPVAAEFVLSPPWSFFRTVLPTGQTEPGTREGTAPAVFGLHRILDERGTATFDTLASIPFEVNARPQDGDLPPARGRLRGGETLRLTVAEGRRPREIRGRILDTVRNQPVEGARVESFRDGAENVTDARGRFLLTGLPEGLVEVRVYSRRHAFPRLAPVDPDARPTLEVRLDPARRVPLRVLDADGRPARVVVSVRDAEDRTVILKDRYGNYDGDVAETDHGGRVDLLGIPAGPVVLVIERAEGEEPQHFELDAYEVLDRLVTLRLAR